MTVPPFQKYLAILARSGILVRRLARLAAIIGALVLVAMAVITLASVIGRALIPLGLRPLRGQFELVEAGTLFAVCAFLPWCHLNRGHASIGVLTDLLGPRINGVLDFAGDLLLTIMAMIMARQLGLGMLDKMEFGETSFLLRYPIWWSYASALFGLVIWIVAGIWSSLNSGLGVFVVDGSNANGPGSGYGGSPGEGI